MAYAVERWSDRCTYNLMFNFTVDCERKRK